MKQLWRGAILPRLGLPAPVGSTEKPGKLAVEADAAALLGDDTGALECTPQDDGARKGMSALGATVGGLLSL